MIIVIQLCICTMQPLQLRLFLQAVLGLKIPRNPNKRATVGPETGVGWLWVMIGPLI